MSGIRWAYHASVIRRQQGRVNPAVFLIALMLLLVSSVAWMAFGRKGSSLPQTTSILTEGFGTTLRVGMALKDARGVKLPEKSVVDLVYLSPEQLASHNLYNEHSAQRDLIAVIGTDLGDGKPVVQGLRAYLGGMQAEGEHATLNGQFAANLGIEEVKQMYGPPFKETPEQNGRVHLVYYFADPLEPRMAYMLTTSHDYTGKIFAMALEHVIAPH